MVYKEYSQLSRYHTRPEAFLTTNSHFYDSATTESPNPEKRVGHHKHSTFAKCFAGSPSHHQLYGSGKLGNTAATSSLSGKDGLFPDPMQRTAASATYRGNGTFTVEYPHSSLTYKSLRLVPYAKLGWKSEYSDKFTNKKPYPGYSVLSSRR